MIAIATWRPTDTTVEFTVTNSDTDEAIPVVEWGTCDHLQSHDGQKPVCVGSLLRLYEEEKATEREEGMLAVPWLELVQLPEESLAALALPRAADLALEIKPSGSFSSKNFRLNYLYLRDFRQLSPAHYERQGGLLTDNAGSYLLPYPIYPLVEKIEGCTAQAADLPARLMLWGEIAAELPGDSLVDGSLATKRIYVPSTVTPEPTTNDLGEPDFRPRLGTMVQSDDPTMASVQFKQLLPPNKQDAFSQKWSDLEVRDIYSLGANAFVFVKPELKRVLGVLREIHKESVEKRTDFLDNPDALLQRRLDPEDEEEGHTYGDVIHLTEYSYSDRVTGIGSWQPRVIPWIRMEGNDWFDVPGEDVGVHIPGVGSVSFGNKPLDVVIDEMETAISNNKPFVEVDGTKIPATPDNLTVLRKIRTRVSRNPNPQDPKATPTEDQVALVRDNLGKISYTFNERKRRRLREQVPGGLRNDLLTHQQQALLWLQQHYHSGTPGALLADDMGLGKTLVALAFLKWLRQGMEDSDVPRRPILIVGPVGLLKNWEEEHDKHLDAPGLGPLKKAYGRELKTLRLPSASTGHELRHGSPKLDLEKLRLAPWVTTSYETLRDYQHSFGQIKWAAAIFDEAQKIKNPNAKVTDAALALEVDFALIVTGTPVENRVADIWTLLDRAQPAQMGSLKDFSTRYENSTDIDEGVLAQLHNRLTERQHGNPKIMMRRLKHEHLKGLPEKREHFLTGDMPAVQAQEYMKAIQQGKQQNPLESLQRIRSISLHPHGYDSKTTPEAYIQLSARLTLTIQILDSVRDRGEKALVFVESRRMQDFLVGHLRRRYRLPNPVHVINGAVSGENRQRRVNSFQSDDGFDVMILSPKAGGVGLTLTAANHVVHLSRWWNPAVEDQCTDRVYRIGQRRNVDVYYPIAVHPIHQERSFDHTLHRLLKRKREVSRTLLTPARNSKQDLTNLYKETFQGVEHSPVSDDVRQIDVMDGRRFEHWVTKELNKGGSYHALTTAAAGDGGVDVIAERQHDGFTLLVQCKHTGNIDTPCGVEGVREIAGSLGQTAYQDLDRDRTKLMVVTNAKSFSAPARELARANNIELIARDRLLELRIHGQAAA